MDTSKQQAFWAAYSSMAAYNGAKIIAHINNKISGKNEQADESNLLKKNELFDLNKIDDPKNKLKVDLYYKHLPFLNYYVSKFDESNITKEKSIANIPLSKQMNIIIDILNLLAQVRNNKAHYINSNYKVSNEVSSALDYCFDTALNEVIKRFFDNAKKGNDKLSHLRRYKGKNKKNEDFDYYITNNKNSENNFTEKGLAFFLCLFLDKKDSRLMLSQISGFKRTDKIEYRSLFELYTISSNRIKLPKEKIEGIFPADQLGLDILNELQKCPKELYEHLSEDDKKKFYVGDENYEMTILKRSENRFACFVMRYFDEEKIFKNIRFHIDLGLYNKDCYEKTLKDGTKLERRIISKRLKAFGRIQDMYSEFEKSRKENPALFNINQQEYTTPNRTITYPHYHFANNEKTLVGIRLKEENNDNTDYMYSDIEKNNFNLKRPDAYISTYEFPAMCFLEHLKKRICRDSNKANLL